MKFNKSVITVVVFVLIFIMCVKEKLPPKLVFIGNDTLSITALASLRPDSTLTDVQIIYAARTIAISRNFNKSLLLSDHENVISALVEQIYNESSQEWSRHGAQTLYSAIRFILFANSADILKKQMVAIDNSVILPDGITLKTLISDDLFTTDTSIAAQKTVIENIAVQLLGTTQQVATILAEFIVSESFTGADTQDLEKMANNLFHDNTEKESVVTRPKRKKHIKDNSMEILKYRDLKSIRETISKHIGTIKGIYRKQLKITPDMEGVIYVSFVVKPSGTIISATIKSSQISQNTFINPFLTYIHKIRFSSIPENIGDMRFDFPFEFNKNEQ